MIYLKQQNGTIIDYPLTEGQLRDQLFSGNVKVALPDKLTAEIIGTYGYAKVHERGKPYHNPLTQVVEPNGPALDGGIWVETWKITALEADVVDANLREAKDVMWKKIKAERDERKSGGVKLIINDVPHWFHTDDATRSQLAILDLKALRASWPPSTVIHPAWKTMGKQPNGLPITVPMTVARLREVLDQGIALDMAVFQAAEVHRAAMEAMMDPDNYNFSQNWPERFVA